MAFFRSQDVLASIRGEYVFIFPDKKRSTRVAGQVLFISSVKHVSSLRLGYFSRSLLSTLKVTSQPCYTTTWLPFVEFMSESEADSVSEGSVNLVEDSFFRQIRDAVSRPQVAFCCAGKLPITAESSFEQIRDTLKDGQLKSGPVTIRWDRKDGKTISKVVLPIISGEGRGTGRPSKKQKTASDVVVTQSQAAIQDLLDDSAPASFGKGGKDVLDDSYRKAVKLDSDQFSTNFNPYDLGIIAAIAQTLLPGVARPILKKARPMSKRAKDCTFSECLGVIAELYKLNVC